MTANAETTVNRCLENCETDKPRNMSCVRTCNYEQEQQKEKKRIKAFMIHKGILNQDFQNYIKTFKDKRKQATVKRISLIS